MKKLITQEWFGIVALSLLLIPQIAHTVYVFNLNSQYRDPWFGWCYAAGVDFAILIFTVKGWRRTAIVYFFGTLAHNVVYQFWPESVWSSILICIMLSATIFSFSHLFYAANETESKEPACEKSTSEKEAEKLSIAKSKGIRIVALPYQCPACIEAFLNKKKLNGHISGHKQKYEWHTEQYSSQWEEDNERRASMLKKLKLMEDEPEPVFASLNLKVN